VITPSRLLQHRLVLTINTLTMPKKSSKKSSKKRTSPAETTLIPHRAPNLTDLLECAKGGKLSDVQEYLSAGGSANVLVEVLIQQVVTMPMRDSVSALIGDQHTAPLITRVALSKHSDAAASIQLLLTAGAAVDAVANGTASGILERTALVLCAVSGNLNSVPALLQGGANPCHQASGDGMTALHFAAAHGHLDICRALHTACSGRALELVGKGDRMSATPLIAACAMEQYAAVKLLCALGADVNNTSITGTTPLMTAAASEGRDTSILQFLLQQDGINVNKGDGIGGSTALMRAIEQGSG
jgi:Ankyrin repeats (many copies)